MTTVVAEQDTRIGVMITYGHNECPVDIVPGTNLAAVLKLPNVRATLGLKDGEPIATIKGTHVDPSYTLRAGDQIEVVRAVDEKA